MKNAERQKAVKIGTVCIASYITSYYMRHILGVLTPGMLETGLYTKEYIGILSSAYLLIYAVGQLVNGITGDIIRPKKMILCGLAFSGVSLITFSFTDVHLLQIVCFGAMGFGLSMLRGPIMKTISENTLPKYARTICAFFSSASFIGTFVASFLALIFKWKEAFIAAGLIAVAVGIAAYTVITLMEKKGMIETRLMKGGNFAEITKVFKLDKFIFYMLIGMLVEIVFGAINFWIPTYLTEHLGFAKNNANLIFSVMSVISAVTPVISLILFKVFKEKDVSIVKYAFLIAAVFCVLMNFVNNPWLNILLFLMARMSVGCASAMLWSIYIPSLGKTGKVSSANGILDCAGYIAASAANAVFGSIAAGISWNGMVYIWCGLMFLGFPIAVLADLKFKKMKNQQV